MAQTLVTVCSHDCPDACSIEVEVEGGRATRIRGNPNHPVTRGFLCGKVARYLDRVYSPERLLYPMRRVGAKGEGRFERISWNDALETIAERLTSIASEFGPESILPYSYAGTMGYLNGAGMDRRFFHRLGASLLARTICSEAGAAALNATNGVRVGTEPEQFARSKLILAWGANILGTNVHLWPFIVEARRRGARFYVIDPHLNRTGRQADWHLPIHPGSDAALALGMLHVILAEGLYDADYVARYTLGFEDLRQRVQEYPPERAAPLTGIAAPDIIHLAREYATVRPAVIRLNYGLQRSERGGMAVRTIAMLPAVTGSWREVGGGLQLSTSQAFRLRRDRLEMPELCLRSALGRMPRTVNMVELGKALLDLDAPPVKALFVYNSNPAAIAPHQNRVLHGLRRDALFTVVSEQFQTDTADYADILLPATTFLEHTDLYFAYGHYYLQLARPVIAPLGEALSNVELFRRLARCMGFTEPCFADLEDDMLRAALDSDHPWVQGITLERLDQEHSVRLSVSQPGQPFLPFAEGRFETPSGKCELRADSLSALSLDPLPSYTPPSESRLGESGLYEKYPLELISPKSPDLVNSTFSNMDSGKQAGSRIEIHPGDAASRRIRDGDPVRVFNDRGSCRLIAAVAPTVASGVICTQAVRWNKRSPGGSNVNALTSDRLTDMGGGPTFYSTLVEVERYCEADGNKSVEFFDAQFQRQIRTQDYLLNPFETRALDYLNGTVLDLGCGLGNLSLEAGRRGHRVMAVDASPAAVARINADAKQQGLPVQAIQADIETWDIDQPYDTIVAIGLFMFFPRERALELLRSIQDYVKPGGRAIVNTLIEGTTYMGMFHPGRYYLFQPDELEERFAGWKILSSQRETFPAPGDTRKEFSTFIAEKPAARLRI